MNKTAIGPQTLIFPKPVFLVGANVNNKPNFMTLAWGGIASGDPPMISVALQNRRYTLEGIRQNSTFSVNIPSRHIARETDYCGLHSGADIDKVAVCRFDLFYGRLGTAPLIEQCPVNLECEVAHMLELGSHTLVIGRINETYVSESGMTNGKPDVYKIAPMIYSGSPARDYLELGQVIGKAYEIGKEPGGHE